MVRFLQFRYVAFLLAAGIPFLGSVQSVGGADKEIKVAPLAKEERQMAQNVLRGRQPDSEQARNALRKALYYELARLTQTKEIPNYGSIRQSILATYVLSFKPEAAAAHEYAVKTLAQGAASLAQDAEFSPQTRVNAIALLAELDDIPVSGRMPPRPSMYARNPLYAVAANEKMPIYLRAVALYGLQRQMAIWWDVPSEWKSQIPQWDQDFKSRLGSLLVKIINSQPNNPLEESAHRWMVRRAYDCLATIQNPAVAPTALGVLVDADAPLSLRLTAANYLSQVDSSKFTDEQKSDYLIGVAHMLRSGLVAWYEAEDDKLKRVGGAMMMGGGYGGPGMGGPGMGGPGMGGSDYGSEGYGGYGGSEGYGSEGYGGYGMGPGAGGSAGARPKPKDTQTWDALLARRRANQIAEIAHLCLNAIPAPEGKKPQIIGIPLAEAGLPQNLSEKLNKLIEALEAFQTAINDPVPVTDPNSLLNVAELPIEDIMELVLEIPGFSDKYPDLVADDDLATVSPAPKDNAPAGGQGQGGTNQGGPAGGEDPGVNGADRNSGQQGGNGTSQNGG